MANILVIFSRCWKAFTGEKNTFFQHIKASHLHHLAGLRSSFQGAHSNLMRVCLRKALPASISADHNKVCVYSSIYSWPVTAKKDLYMWPYGKDQMCNVEGMRSWGGHPPPANSVLTLFWFVIFMKKRFSSQLLLIISHSVDWSDSLLTHQWTKNARKFQVTKQGAFVHILKDEIIILEQSKARDCFRLRVVEQNTSFLHSASGS